MKPATVYRSPLPPLLVRASAGTGKTYRLTGRLLALLLQGAPIDSILATTFTRKAAGEILNRILITLAKGATDPSDRSLDQVRQQVDDPLVSQDDCLRLLHRLVRNIHHLRISTLDSLFSQIARSFPFELGLPPGWRLTEDIEETWLRERAVETMLSGLESTEVTTLLSMLSKGEVRRTVHRDLLGIITDAYSESRRSDDRIWVKLILPEGPKNEDITQAAGILATAQIGHKTADKRLHLIGACLENRDWDRLSNETPVKLAGAGKPSNQPPLYYRKPLPPVVLDALDIAYQGARTEVLSLLRLQTEATGKILNSFDHQIQSLKQSARVLGFDDVAFRLARWIDSQDAQTVAHRLDGTIDHVLLDEFQDTSPEQWGVLKPFASHAVAGKSPIQNESSSQNQPHSSFFCVGDTKQAIYGWRGGVAAIFDAVTEQIPGIQQTQQDKSFRSSPVITETVTQIFQNVARHPSFCDPSTETDVSADRNAYESMAIEKFANQFPHQVAAQEDLPGFVRFESGPMTGDSPSDQQRQLLVHVAERIRQLVDNVPDRSIGVLTRTNATVARLIYLLRARGVDVSQEGGNPLTDSAAVELMLSTLMLAEHPGDGRWWYHVSNSPLAQSNRLPQHCDAYSAAAFIRHQVEEHGLTAALHRLADPVAAICNQADCLRLRQLLQLAQRYEANPQNRLRDFVRMVRLTRVERPQPAQVRVMTIHQAKGLEFDIAILPELDGPLTRQGRKCIASTPDPTMPPDAIVRYLGTPYWHFLPQRWQRTFGLHAAGLITEAMCLLYVALTRPRHALYLFAIPAKKPDYANRTGASLLYHALGCEADPTTPETVWYTAGDPNWHQHLPATDAPTIIPEPRKKVGPQPMGSPPKKNREVVQ